MLEDPAREYMLLEKSTTRGPRGGLINLWVYGGGPEEMPGWQEVRRGDVIGQ